MGKKKAFKPKKATPCSRMYPSLHQIVTNAVSEHVGSTTFHEDDSDDGSTRECSTFVRGIFTCRKRACPGTAWASGKITIVIRRYMENEYNAVVFSQRCKFCEQLGTLKLEEQSYVDRVSYRLKKWAGVEMETHHYIPKEMPPHKAHLCEGCKRGVCREGTEWKLRRNF
jgi:hypothetical protein